MIIAKLKWNTRLVELDEFVEKFIKKETYQHFDIDIKLTNSALFVYFSKRLN